MVELRREDPISFKNFMRMPPEMFDEILQWVRGRRHAGDDDCHVNVRRSLQIWTFRNVSHFFLWNS